MNVVAVEDWAPACVDPDKQVKRCHGPYAIGNVTVCMVCAEHHDDHPKPATCQCDECKLTRGESLLP